MAPEPDTGGLLRAWSRIEAMPWWLFSLWVTVLLVVRSGVSWSGTAELEAFARSFPHPGTTFRSNSVVGPTLAWATGMNASHTRWLLLHAGFTLGWFVLTAGLLRRRLGPGRASRVALVWLTFVALPPSLLHHLGSYDVFTAVGATLVALGGTPLLAILGGALMGATNVEQGVAAVCCGALVQWAIPAADRTEARPREHAPTILAALAGLAASRILVLIWFERVDAHVQGRAGEFARLAGDSIHNAASLGGAGAYAWLSVGWVVVITVVWCLRDRPARWIAATIGLLGVPAAATVLTLDGSRVFAAVGGVALLVALVWFARMAESSDGEWILRGTAALMLFGILIPVVVTTYRGGIRVPWRFMGL